MADISAVLDIFSSTYTCLSGLNVGDPVYLSAADTVLKADGTNGAKMPAIGIVVNKPTTTTCILQLGGELTVTGPLVAGTTYYVGSSGLTSSTAGLAVIQEMGIAKDTTTLIMVVPSIVGSQSITGNLAVSGNLSVAGHAGFFGTTAIAQPANTTGTRQALINLGLIASGGDGLFTPQRIALSDAMRNNDGTVMDATGGAGKFSISLVIGTSQTLLGEAAQNNTKTDNATTEIIIGGSYIAAQNLTLTLNAKHVEAGGTTLTNTVNAHLYRYADDGSQGADLISHAALAITGSNADYAFTVTGATLNPGDRVLLQIVSIATEGGNTGTTKNQINSIRLS